MRATDRTQHPGPPKAFTIVELLVALAIIGVLAAILLPAIQSGRGQARRLECQNRLKQVSLAAANFESTHRKGADADRLLADLAGFLESAAPTLDEDYSTDVVWLCPLEDVRPSIGAYSFLPCDGLAAWDDTPSGYVGPYAADQDELIRRLRSALEVADGLSQTIQFSERRVSLDNSVTPLKFNVNYRDVSVPRGEVGWYLAGSATSADELRLACQTPTDRNIPAADPTLRRGGRMVAGHHGFNVIGGPNSWTCYNAAQPDAEEQRAGRLPVGAISEASAPATSDHAGGVNTTRGDGSVHFTSEAIDIDLWRALATVAGSETLDDVDL